MTRAAGIDVGGTKFFGVILDDAGPDGRGSVVVEKRRPTPHGGEAVVQALAAFAGELGEYDTLGVGVPGLVTRRGVLRAAPNLIGASEVPVGPRLTEILGHPVSVNDESGHYATTFADVAAGRLLLYEDAYRWLALAVNRGSAADLLGLRLDDEVRIKPAGE